MEPVKLCSIWFCNIGEGHLSAFSGITLWFCGLIQISALLYVINILLKSWMWRTLLTVDSYFNCFRLNLNCWTLQWFILFSDEFFYSINSCPLISFASSHFKIKCYLKLEGTFIIKIIPFIQLFINSEHLLYITLLYPNNNPLSFVECIVITLCCWERLSDLPEVKWLVYGRVWIRG